MPGSSKDTAPRDGLVIGGIYIALFVRDQPPRPNDFHWALYVHTEPKSGRKYHIKSLGAGWIVDHGPENGVLKTFLLVGLFHVATISPGKDTLDWLDGIFRTYDTRLNTPEITCRVWVLWILQLLKSDNILECDDLAALEREVFEFGNKYATDAADAKQPRPVETSKICRGL